MKKLKLNKQVIRELTAGLGMVRGGANTHETSCITFDPEPNTAGCSTTGPWQTEYSCLTCRCLPQ